MFEVVLKGKEIFDSNRNNSYFTILTNSSVEKNFPTGFSLY
jgi:hypothetical protein